jgi:DNA-binding MarR family transcriptional regulator
MRLSTVSSRTLRSGSSDHESADCEPPGPDATVPAAPSLRTSGSPAPGSPPPGFELPILLLSGFRALIDDVHGELARQGHPDVRPYHGFVFQAIGGGTTAAELGRRLGVSKQAAGKTIESLERQGYVERADDPHDARRKMVRLTERGVDVLVRSARIFDVLRAQWAGVIGEERLAALEDDLRKVTPREMRLDVPGWLGG